MKALVTGATGLVGANLVRALLRRGFPVRALVRPASDTRALAGLPIEIATGDVMDPASLAVAVTGCDFVFHAAAVFAYWNRSADALLRLAADGTRNVVDAAAEAGVRRVVLTSSTVVLGSDTEPRVRDERGEFNETDDYARSKAAQEEAGFARARERGIELVAVCPGLCLGAHDHRLSPSNAIVCSYLEDPWKLTWPGGANLVSVQDVALGHLLAAERGEPGSRYVLGSENLEWPAVHRLIASLCGAPEPRHTANHTSSYLAAAAQEVVAKWTGRPPRTTRAQARMVGRYYWYSHARASALGFAPRPARQALAESVAWLLATPHISMSLRASLRPAPEVYAAWEEHRAAEAALVRTAPVAGVSGSP